MTTKSSGFSLIELMVVVAIIGILAAVGTVTYSGYIAGTKKVSAKNVMQQISLAQTEEYSNAGGYHTQGDSCDPSGGTGGTSKDINDTLFGEGDVIDDGVGYEMCIYAVGTNSYTIKAVEDGDIAGGCTIELTQNGAWSENANC